MNRRARILRAGRFLALAFLVAATGCSSSLVGAWENTSEQKGESFYITNATFKDNGDYVATAKQGGEDVRLAGTYEFDGFKLKLKTAGKPERTYGATFIMMGPSLELRNGDQKQTLKKK